MRLLILGGNGRLGREIQSHELPPDIVAEFAVSPNDPDPARVTVDVTDQDAVHRAIAGFHPDVVLHLASITGPAADAAPDRAEAVNAESLRHVSRAAAAEGVSRVVLVSSSSVYGDRYGEPVQEDGLLDPVSVYARSKLRGEEELASGAGPFDAVILRIFNIYGPRFENSLVTRLLRSSAEGPVPLRDLDGFVRDYIHASDVVAAILASVRAPRAEDVSIYNIGSGVATSNRRLVQTLERHAPILFTEIGGVQSYSCANVDRARRDLGLTARPL